MENTSEGIDRSEPEGAKNSGQLTVQQKGFQRRPMRTTISSTYVVWFLLIMGTFCVFGLQRFYFDYIGQITNTVEPGSISVAFIVSLLCVRRYGTKIRERLFARIWFLIAMGMGLWTIANIVWSTDYFLGIPVPYPGLSDYFYLTADIPLGIALTMYLKSFTGAFTRRRVAISAAVIIFSASIIIDFVLRSEFAMKQPIAATITDLAYPFSDIVLLTLTILNLAIFFGGSYSRWWLLTGLGIVLYILADELFLYQNSLSVYYNGSSADLCYVLSYLVLAIASWTHRRAL